MSPIATLEQLEPYLSHVVICEKPKVPAPKAEVPQVREVMANGSQGSHLELFFSEIKYKTFVTEKRAEAKNPTPVNGSGNSHSQALKFRLRLH